MKLNWWDKLGLVVLAAEALFLGLMMFFKPQLVWSIFHPPS